MLNNFTFFSKYDRKKNLYLFKYDIFGDNFVIFDTLFPIYNLVMEGLSFHD